MFTLATPFLIQHCAYQPDERQGSPQYMLEIFKITRTENQEPFGDKLLGPKGQSFM